MKLLFLPGTYTSPSARFRQWQFVKPLQARGHQVEVRVTDPHREWTPAGGFTATRLGRKLASLRRVSSAMRIIADAAEFDAVYVHKDIVPELWADFLERRLRNKTPRSLFDFDDAIHLGNRREKLERILPGYARVIVGNEFLAGFARQHNRQVEIWPTVVDTEVYEVRRERAPGPIRLGWSGSHHTLQTCFPLIKEVVAELAKEREFEFIIIANVAPQLDWPGVNWRFIPWTPETEVQGLHAIDIGLMPLKDEPFERGKCGLKAIQYMAVGTPALVSPIGVNAEIVVPGEHGFHCRTDAEWLTAFRILLDNPELRLEIGSKAVERVEAHYSVRSLVPKMVATFEAVAGQHP